MKMKRFTLVLGVLFMGSVLATSMTSCGNTDKKETKDEVAPAAGDEAVNATQTEEADAVAKCGEGKCGDGKCGGGEAADTNKSVEDKAAEKEAVLKGEVEAPATDKEKELSKDAPVVDDAKKIGDEAKAPKEKTLEKKCGGK